MRIAVRVSGYAIIADMQNGSTDEYRRDYVKREIMSKIMVVACGFEKWQ